MVEYTVLALEMKLGKAEYRIAAIMPNGLGGKGLLVRAWKNKHGSDCRVWADYSSHIANDYHVKVREKTDQNYQVMAPVVLEENVSTAALLRMKAMHWIFTETSGSHRGKLITQLQMNERASEKPDLEAIEALSDLLTAAQTFAPTVDVDAKVVVPRSEPASPPEQQMVGWGAWS